MMKRTPYLLLLALSLLHYQEAEGEANTREVNRQQSHLQKAWNSAVVIHG
jgi:hypothetical protein